MVKLVEKKWCACVGEYRLQFIVDTDADFANLPDACAGSEALCIESGKLMVVNASGEWVPFAESEG